MVIVFALLAALSNAVNEATQHVASIAAPRKSSGWRLVVYLFRNPLWLFGWIALAGAFVFQAVALHDGHVSVVQPLLATELVFMLILRRVWIHQSIRPITWGATVVTCVSLAVFILAGQPGGSQQTPVSSTGCRPRWPAVSAPRRWRSWRVGDPQASALLFTVRPRR